MTVHDLRKTNQSLLCIWWWKLETKEDMWQKVVAEKYMKQKTISCLRYKNTNTPVWNNLLKVRDIYLKERRIRIGDDKSENFWKDKWCGFCGSK